MKIIVGLGNPGEQYQNTRHNAGWLALDVFLGAVKWQKEKKFAATIYKDGEFLFVKALTFMNNSGLAVQKILNYYKLLPKTLGILKKRDADLSAILTVIHDDVDLNLGDYRLSVNAASAGHRGVQSIINHLKTKNFTRLRLGTRNELFKTHIPPDEFVLQAFRREEKEKIKAMLAGLNLKNLK